MATVQGRGILKHHFWGDYSATIGIEFPDAAQAADCLPMLGDGWETGKNPSVLVWFGSKDAFEAVKAKLVSFGADEKKIDSIAKSIDYGEPFTITCEVVYPVSPDQTSFPFMEEPRGLDQPDDLYLNSLQGQEQ